MSYGFHGFRDPSSGTNLVTSLIKSLDGSYVYNEPFSKNLSWVLKWDLIYREENQLNLSCRCGFRDCFICNMNEKVKEGVYNFKETLIFEYLHDIRNEFNLGKSV